MAVGVGLFIKQHRCCFSHIPPPQRTHPGLLFSPALSFPISSQSPLDILKFTAPSPLTEEYLDMLTTCCVSTGRQPDLGGALSDCHLLSVVGVSPKVFSQCLIRDGTLQHVSSKTATLQPVRSCKQNTQG